MLRKVICKKNARDVIVTNSYEIKRDGFFKREYLSCYSLNAYVYHHAFYRINL